MEGEGWDNRRKLRKECKDGLKKVEAGWKMEWKKMSSAWMDGD